MKYKIVLALICTLFFNTIQSLGAAEIKDIRIWHAPDRSRIVLDMDQRVQFNVFVLNKPSRLVVDLESSSFKSSQEIRRKLGQFIHKMRIGTPKKHTIRLVFELKKPVRYFVRTLDPAKQYGYRLVIDLYHRDAVLAIDRVEKSTKAPLLNRQLKNKEDRLRILIDPGHGGEDPGALGKTTQEKKIVLKIARYLKKIIDKEKGMEAQLTRSGDYYVGLRQRTNLARQAKADLFISIHADSVKNIKAQGASVYVLSKNGASSETAKWIANKENSADLIGGVSIADKDDHIANTILNLSMNNTMRESVALGKTVLSELKKIGNLHSERVEKAGFVVLKSPDIPSILVEAAYISNPKEERKLMSSRYQKRIATAILKGIKKHTGR